MTWRPWGRTFGSGTSVLVGSTTNGSWLADIGHWNELIDRLTTMLSFAPVPAAVDALESVFALVRSLAVEVDHDLAGLDAMAPTRPYLKEVNAHPTLAPDGSYRAILSDYEPSDPDLKAFFADEFKDSVIFKGPNDGMVGDRRDPGRRDRRAISDRRPLPVRSVGGGRARELLRPGQDEQSAPRLAGGLDPRREGPPAGGAARSRR